MALNEYYEVREDAAEGVNVTLDLAEDSESEPGEPLQFVVSSLPTLGTLYTVAAGVRREISAPYDRFDSGEEPITQYASRVLGVSSYYGAATPCDTPYHAVGILGPPSCNSFGECDGERMPLQAWLNAPLPSEPPPEVGVGAEGELICTTIAPPQFDPSTNPIPFPTHSIRTNTPKPLILTDAPTTSTLIPTNNPTPSY